MTNGTSDDLSQMAHTLEKSGDYRVLRRLVPRDVITPVPADQQIKVGSLFDVETTGLRIGQKALRGPVERRCGRTRCEGGSSDPPSCSLSNGVNHRSCALACCKVQNMPRGNPHPVTKGRKRGVPNKFSIARVERAIAEGRKQPPEELLRNAENCRAMAVHFAPMRVNADTGQREVNPDHNPKDYFDWLAAERDALGRAAPYYSPRLMAMAVQTATLDRDKEARADPRVALLEMILQMRDRDELGQHALPAPKSNGRGEIIEAVVAKVVEEDDDNGDGEAA